MKTNSVSESVSKPVSESLKFPLPLTGLLTYPLTFWLLLINPISAPAAEQLTINVGSAANDGAGDTVRAAFQKVNTNFTSLFNMVSTGTGQFTATNECHTVPNANTNVLVVSGAGTSAANGTYTQSTVGIYLKTATTHGIYTDGIDWFLTNSFGTPLYGLEGDNPSGSAWSVMAGVAPAPASVFDSVTNCVTVPFWGGFPQDASATYVNSNTVRSVIYANAEDDLPAIWTNLPNNSILKIGGGNWTNTISRMFGGGNADGRFALVNKTNIQIEFTGNAWLWNTNFGDTIQLSNCSKIKLIAPNIYGYRFTNSGDTTVFSAICLCSCKDILITRGTFINCGDWVEAEALTTGNTYQSTNVEVSFNYHFNCGSFFGGTLVYDGGGTLPGSYWWVHHNTYVECVRPIEIYGQSIVPVVIGSRIEDNWIINPISFAIWDSGATNNWYHIIKNNHIHIEDRFRTVSSNSVEGITRWSGPTRGFVFDGNVITGGGGIPFGGVGFRFTAPSSFRSWDLTLCNNHITNVDYGIQIDQGGSDGKYRGVTFHHNQLCAVQNGAFNLGGSDILLENNELVDCALASQSALWLGVASWTATNIIARHNIIRASPGVSPSGSGILIDTGCNGCQMFDNEVATAYSPRFSDSGAGTLWTSGLKARNGGTNVVALTGTKTIDFGSISAGGVNTNHITVTGAGIGDPCFIGAPTNALISAAACTGLVFSAAVYVSNVVQITVANVGTAACDPASGTYRVTVLRWNGDR